MQSFTTAVLTYLLSRLFLLLCFIYILLWRCLSSWSMADAWGIITGSERDNDYDDDDDDSDDDESLAEVMI